VSVKVTPTSVTEDGPNTLTYEFTASPAPTSAITVAYRIGGSAKAGSDFTGLPPGATAGTITIPAGSTSPVTLTIVPTPDTVVEPDETVVITLLPGTGYSFGSKTVAAGTIENDDYRVDLVLDGLPEETSPVPNELAPGAILPIGGDRVSLIANVPAGRTATLAIAKGAVRVYDQQAGGNPVLGPPGQPSIEVVGGQPRAFWVEAITPGVNLADIELTLTAVVSTGRQTPPPSDKVRATAVDIVSIKAIDDVAHEQYRDTGTFVITRERGNLDTLIPVQIIVSGDADYNWHYRLDPDLPPWPVGGHAHSSTISLLPGVDRLIVTLTPLREDRDNHERKAVLELVPPQIPLYAVAKGYDKAEVTIIPDPQDGDLEITGTITYEGPKGIAGGSTLTLGALPVRGARVEIWDQGLSGNTPVATAYTDDNGNYSVRIPSADPTPGGGYVDPYIVVIAQSAPETVATKTVATIAHEVSIAGESSPARKEFIGNVVPRGPGRAVLDGAMTNADADDRPRNAAFSVFDAIHSASRYHVTLPGVQPGTVKAKVINPADPSIPSAYLGNGKIEIVFNQRFSWDTICHEYGHFAHDHAGVTLGRGEHSFSENLRFRDYSAAWRKAFTEGFATYFSIVAQARTPKPPAGVAGFGDTAYWSVKDLSIISHTDLEAEGPSVEAKYGSLGEDNEVSVFRTLWDLYDPANDDPIGDIGEIGVWNLVTTGKAQTMPSVKFLYQDLIGKASVERKWEIGKVLAEHKIVPSPLRVDLHGATPLESLDNPPTFVISALYGSDYGKQPNKWLFKDVQIRFYTSTGLLLDVDPGSTDVPPPAGLPAEISWTPSKDVWAKVMVAWVGEPIRWSVLATTELTDSGVLSQYESFSQTLTFA
jgi:hypothetical protein